MQAVDRHIMNPHIKFYCTGFFFKQTNGNTLLDSELKTRNNDSGVK